MSNIHGHCEITPHVSCCGKRIHLKDPDYGGPLCGAGGVIGGLCCPVCFFAVKISLRCMRCKRLAGRLRAKR